jgi:hypothetical protein
MKKIILLSLTCFIVFLLGTNQSNAQKTYKVGDSHPSGGIVYHIWDEGGTSGLLVHPKTEQNLNYKQAMEHRPNGWELPDCEALEILITNREAVKDQIPLLANNSWTNKMWCLGQISDEAEMYTEETIQVPNLLNIKMEYHENRGTMHSGNVVFISGF